jgi:hypothetical protein
MYLGRPLEVQRLGRDRISKATEILAPQVPASDRFGRNPHYFFKVRSPFGQCP